MTAATATGDAQRACRGSAVKPTRLLPVLAQHRFGVQLSVDAAAWALALMGGARYAWRLLIERGPRQVAMTGGR